MWSNYFFNLCFLWVMFSTVALPAQLPTHLYQINEMEYVGAFRIPAGTEGASDMNYSEGPLVYNPTSHSIFIVGHDHQQAIAEYSIPALDTGLIQDLNMATNLQPFVQHLDQVSCGNSQNINQIAGLALINGSLYVNAYEYYDADASVSHTTLILNNPADLMNTAIEGYYAFDGGAGHTAGWISEIPPVWEDTLGGSHLTGFSSGIPIISRCSVGPSAFSFSPVMDTLDCVSNSIATNRLLDFSLGNPLHADLSNDSLTNDIWTHLSRATFGMIIPGTHTYMTLGYSGGHESGVCYKCTQDNGNECGGYCAPQADDYNQYYWFWDVHDLIAAKEGLLSPFDIRPYDYGPFHTPYENSTKQIGGGTYDVQSGLLYLTIQKADREQGTFANPPIIVAYQLSPPAQCLCCKTSLFIETSDVFDGMEIYAQGLHPVGRRDF